LLCLQSVPKIKLSFAKKQLVSEPDKRRATQQSKNIFIVCKELVTLNVEAMNHKNVQDYQHVK